MFFRFVLVFLAIVAGESKLDSATFTKVVLENLSKTESQVIVHVQKKYGYDSKSLSFHVSQGVASNAQVMVMDLELDGENSSEGEDAEPEDEENDYKMKERVAKESDGQLMERLDISVDDLPFMALVRGGRIVDRLPVDSESTELDEVEAWLQKNSIMLHGKVQFPELEPALSNFAAGKNKADWEAAISEAEKVIETLDGDANVYLKVMRNAMKNGKPTEYVEKETARLSNMVRSDAITVEKKQEMKQKLNVLKILAQNLGGSKAESREEL